MCSWVATIVQAVGNDVTSLGNVMNQSDQADAARENSKRAKFAAAQAYRDGEYEAGVAQIQAGHMAAKQEALGGASGFSLDSETFSDVMRGTQQNFALDVGTIRSNAARAAKNYQYQASDFRQQARAYDRSAIFGVAGSFFGAAGSGAQAYSSFQDDKRNSSGGGPNQYANERPTMRGNASSSTGLGDGDYRINNSRYA